MSLESTYTAFAGTKRIASEHLEKMLVQTKAYLESHADAAVLIFEDQTGRQVDFDFRGTADEVVRRAAGAKIRPGPGRPKLGVVCREVSLLPRHWEWLEQHPGGISAALRRLVDDARQRDGGAARARAARDAAGKFMWAMAGNFPGFEEASRALYAKDRQGFERLIRDWPEDVRGHLGRLVREADRLDAAGTGP